MRQLPRRDPVAGRRLKVAVALALATSSLAINLYVARGFEAAGAYDAADLFFHADPPTRRLIFAENPTDRVFIKHPNLGNVVHPPLRLAAAVRSSEARRAARWDLALYVSPIAGAIQVAALFLTLGLTGLGIPAATLVALVASLSFSHLIFSSMPESFALSGAWLAVLLLAAAWAVRRRLEVGSFDLKITGCWSLIGVVGIAITTTNLIPLLIVAACVELHRRRSIVIVLRELVVIGLVALMGNALLLGLTVAPSFDADQQARTPVGIRGFVNSRPVNRLRRFPVAVADALAPPAPTFVSDPEGRVPFYFTLERFRHDARIAGLLRGLLWGALLVGAWYRLRGPSEDSALAWAALFILAFNALFHAFWGSELVLYSQHWHAATLYLLAGIALRSSRLERTGWVLLSLTTLFLAYHNQEIVRGLKADWNDRSEASEAHLMRRAPESG